MNSITRLSRVALRRPATYASGKFLSSNNGLAHEISVCRYFSSLTKPVKYPHLHELNPRINVAVRILDSGNHISGAGGLSRHSVGANLRNWNGSYVHLMRFQHSLAGSEKASAGTQLGSADGQPATSPGDKVKEAFKEAEKSNDIVPSSYWGIAEKQIRREDGTVWPWRSFMPWETYTADTSIDLRRHHVPDTFIDKLAFWTVKTLRWPTDLFFQKRYGCRAMMLETVAAVPGMVGGMLLHLRSLRKFEHSGGWIRALLEEAENERMHLMTFMEVANPRWYERALVVAVQGVFFNAYFLCYLASPRLAHRITGYLEEEAIYSYTHYLKEIDNGNIPDVQAPAIAIDYWRLPKDATIRDVVEVVRADEAHHRDVNHYAADLHEEGKRLNEVPAPIGYH